MNASTAQARVIVDELARCGVRHAVLSPGSRSAPLAYALDSADRDGRITLHVRIDERSAGFVALGLAKAGGGPVVVVTTSGTATANLHPAVLEAHESGVPLLLLTADRPPELRGVGANQTVDQTGLYGTSVRWFHEVGVADDRSTRRSEWRALVARAVSTARGSIGGDPGPVHLNLPFREPLTPDDSGDEGWLTDDLEGRAAGQPWTRVEPRPAPAIDDDDGPARTLVVVGDAPRALADRALAAAERAGWPVVSEPSGNARRGPNAVRLGHLLLDRPELVPDRVLVVGRPTLWRSVQALLRRVPSDVVTASPRWPDAPSVARRVLSQVPRPTSVRDDGWLDAWQAADADALAAADVLREWSGPGIAAALTAALPDDALLLAGSSLPIRDLGYAAPRRGVHVLANRGAAGIDGTVSTAIGAALAWPGAASALMGDVTFLHDSNGLALGPEEPVPDLTIVVVNNDGGRIFGLLEHGDERQATSFERVFGTPTRTDLAALCSAHGVGHTRVAAYDELEKAMAVVPDGITLVEAVVAPPSR